MFYEEVHNRKICSAMQTLQVPIRMMGGRKHILKCCLDFWKCGKMEINYVRLLEW
jgi:hypothetical protein